MSTFTTEILSNRTITQFTEISSKDVLPVLAHWTKERVPPRKEEVNSQKVAAVYAIRQFAAHLRSNRDAVVSTLATYQSCATSKDEISRALGCLDTIQELDKYMDQRTEVIVAFFPLNLPLYTFVLFAAVMTLFADKVYVRPPQIMTQLVAKLAILLRVETFFPGVHICQDGRSAFLEKYVTQANVTIFTGRDKNAASVMDYVPSSSLFLFNGWGHNPIVVDIQQWTRLRRTHSILVHRAVASEFLLALKTRLEQVRVGEYTDPLVEVGPLARLEHLNRISAFLVKYHADIVHGGQINYAKAIVHPTVIARPLSACANYEELFSPIFYVSVYDHSQQLDLYFKSPQYTAHAMYVSCFGERDYVDRLESSIVIHDQTVFDIERGNSSFGGLSCGASFVAAHGEKVARPILAPREIGEFLIATQSLRPRISAAAQKRIVRDVQQAMMTYFGHNLVFGFVFGSVASGSATHNSDIDTMVVLHQAEPAKVREYLKWLHCYHLASGMTVDTVYPAEILTLEAFRVHVANMDAIVLSLRYNDHVTFDRVVWADIFASQKQGMVGDITLILEYAKALGKYSKTWKAKVLPEVEENIRFISKTEPVQESWRVQAEINSARRMNPGKFLKKYVPFEELTASLYS